MPDQTIRGRGVGLLVVGLGLTAFGLVWTAGGARAASLEVCSSPSSTCEVVLQIDQFFASFYGPNGLCIVVGVVLAMVGLGLVRRSRHSTSD